MEKLEQNCGMKSLGKYGTDLTKLAEEQKLDPLIGGQQQIELMTLILCRRRKNNPCLGEPGVGKTAIVEGLAQHIVNGDVPEPLKGKKVISLDMGRLVAGTKFRGKFEKRLTKLMDEVKQSNGEVLLFIDELHMLMITGAANILKPALARGDLQCSGATTQDEYKEYIQKDRALERRFQPVKVPEPSISEAIQILKQISPRYEIFHKLNYTHEALVAAVELSKQLISDRYLPDKAIDLIDEAGAFVLISQRQLPEETNELYKDLRKITEEKTEAIRSQNYSKVQSLKVHEKKIKLKISEIKDKTGKGINANGSNLVVTEVDIQHIVSSWTGIPVKKVSTSESRYLLKMEESICKHVIGQEAAVKAICRAIRRARIGIRDPARPIVSLLFAGSTGVGKTQLVKVLATEYFGSKEAMIRFDMSEFMEMHSVSKLIGAPPGYVGYQEGGKLTETVHRRPFTVVLFDEIEKAHRDVFNIMLQILEDGRLTDSKGKTVDFCNTVIIMTSNIGSSAVVNGEQQISTSQVNAKVVEELKKCFRLEFLNRLDDVIVFQRLTKEVVRKIAEIMLNEVIARLKKKGIYLKVTDTFIGYSQTYGARTLRRAIVRLLEDTLADKILAEEIKEGDSVTVDIDSDGEVTVHKDTRVPILLQNTNQWICKNCFVENALHIQKFLWQLQSPNKIM